MPFFMWSLCDELLLQGPPDPFPVPMFKEDVEEALAKRKLSDDNRELVRKFPFLKEYVS